MPMQEQNFPQKNFKDVFTEPNEISEVSEKNSVKDFFIKAGRKVKDFFSAVKDTVKNLSAAVVNRIVLGRKNYEKAVREEYEDARKNGESIFSSQKKENEKTQEKSTEERGSVFSNKRDKYVHGQYYAATVVDKTEDSLYAEIDGRQYRVGSYHADRGKIMSYEIGEEIPVFCETSRNIVKNGGMTEEKGLWFDYKGEPGRNITIVNRPKGMEFNAHTDYVAQVKQVLPEKNLLIIDVNGKEATVHSSAIGNKRIEDFSPNDILNVQYNGVYINPQGRESETFTTQRSDEIVQIHKNAADRVDEYKASLEKHKTEQLKNEPEQEANPFESVEETEPEAPLKENFTETPAEQKEEMSVKCLDVKSFQNAVAQGKDGEYVLYGGTQKGVTAEITAKVKGGQTVYFNARGQEVSEKKVNKILDKHNAVGDIKGALSFLIKNKPDRAESAFSPTVYTYQNQAILVTKEGKTIPVSPNGFEIQQAAEQFKAERNESDYRPGAGERAQECSVDKDTVNAPAEATAERESDTADELGEEDFDENEIDEYAVLRNYDERSEAAARDREERESSDLGL